MITKFDFELFLKLLSEKLDGAGISPEDVNSLLRRGGKEITDDALRMFRNRLKRSSRIISRHFKIDRSKPLRAVLSWDFNWLNVEPVSLLLGLFCLPR